MLVTDSPTTVTTQQLPSSSSLSLSSLKEKEQYLKLIEEAERLLNTVVQLGNHREIEQLQDKIKVNKKNYLKKQTNKQTYFCALISNSLF